MQHSVIAPAALATSLPAAQRPVDAHAVMPSDETIRLCGVRCRKAAHDSGPRPHEPGDGRRALDTVCHSGIQESSQHPVYAPREDTWPTCGQDSHR